MRRRKPLYILIFLLIFYEINAQKLDMNNPLSEMTPNQGRQIFNEIMEIFAPSAISNHQAESSKKTDTSGILNGLFTGAKTASNTDSISSSAPASRDNNPWAQLTKGMLGLFPTTTRAPLTTTSSPSIFQTFYEKVIFLNFVFLSSGLLKN